MSGRKVVTIGEETYRELLNGAREAERLRHQIREKERKAREKAIREFKPVIERLERMFYLNEQEISKLRTELREGEKEFRSMLEEQRQSILRFIGEQNREIKSSIEEIKGRLRTQSGRIEKIEQTIAQMIQQKWKDEEFAQALLNDVKIVFDNVEKLPHQRFAPGEIEFHRLNLRMQEENINRGNYEAAIAGIQRLYLDLVRTKNKIYERERDYLLELENLLERLYYLQEKADLELDFEWIENSSHRKANFWVHGRIEELRKDILRLIDTLNANRDVWTEFELQQVEREIGEIDRKLNLLLEESRRNAILSYERKRIATNVSASAEKQGFLKEKESYFEDDPRKDYIAVLKNFLGDKLIVRTFQEGNTNHVEVNLYPGRGARSQEVQREVVRTILRGIPGSSRIREEELPDEGLREKVERGG